MAAHTRLWRELPYTQAMRGHGETRERRSWAILDSRHLGVTLPFVAHCNCIGFLYSARPGYRPHVPLSTKRALNEAAARQLHRVFFLSFILSLYPCLEPPRPLSSLRHVWIN